MDMAFLPYPFVASLVAASLEASLAFVASLGTAVVAGIAAAETAVASPMAVEASTTWYGFGMRLGCLHIRNADYRGFLVE